jgi:hypothetical protein
MTFTPARTDRRRPKILMYGGAGTGKTTTALCLPGVKAFIDAEDGTDPYVEQFEFDRKKTKDHNEIFAELDKLLADPGKYSMLVLDPISTVHRRLRILADETIRPRTKLKNATITEWDQVLGYGANERIATIMRVLFDRLMALDLAVIVTARAKPLYRIGGGENREQIGITYDGPAGMDHEFHLVLEMRQVGDARIAKVVKARGMRLTTGTEIEATSSREMAQKLEAEHWAGAFTAVGRPVVVASAHAKAEANPAPANGNGSNRIRKIITLDQLTRLQELVKEMGFSHESVKVALRSRGVEMFSELDFEQAVEMLDTLEERLEAKTKAQAQPDPVPPLVGAEPTPVDTATDPDAAAADAAAVTAAATEAFNAANDAAALEDAVERERIGMPAVPL